MQSVLTNTLHEREYRELVQINAETLIANLPAQIEQLLPPLDAEPRRLHQAMRHALSGGKRLRPQLLLRVSETCSGGACQEAEIDLALRAACSVELIHAASLVHDDLPSFDNATLRRGQPTVHVLYGEDTAVLTGDALIALAFAALSSASANLAQRTVRIISMLARSLGAEGMTGGQGMECDGAKELAAGMTEVWSAARIERCHNLKTASLFRMAAEAGAIAVGAVNAKRWGELGEMLGLAFQLADDLYDACGRPLNAGKAVGRDVALGRPNAVHARGESAVRNKLHGLLSAVRAGSRDSATETVRLLDWLDDLTALLHKMYSDPKPSDAAR